MDYPDFYQKYYDISDERIKNIMKPNGEWDTKRMKSIIDYCLRHDCYDYEEYGVMKLEEFPMAPGGNCICGITVTYKNYHSRNMLLFKVIDENDECEFMEYDQIDVNEVLDKWCKDLYNVDTCNDVDN